MIQERLAARLRQPAFGRLAFVALKLLGMELRRSVRVDKRLLLPHGAAGLVAHERTILGDDVMLHQDVTLGRADTSRPQPSSTGRTSVGDHAIIGSNAVAVFARGPVVTVADQALVGAGSVARTSVTPGGIWAGGPAKKVGRRDAERSPMASASDE